MALPGEKGFYIIYSISCSRHLRAFMGIKVIIQYGTVLHWMNIAWPSFEALHLSFINTITDTIISSTVLFLILSLHQSGNVQSSIFFSLQKKPPSTLFPQTYTIKHISFSSKSIRHFLICSNRTRFLYYCSNSIVIIISIAYNIIIYIIINVI